MITAYSVLLMLSQCIKNVLKLVLTLKENKTIQVLKL